MKVSRWWVEDIDPYLLLLNTRCRQAAEACLFLLIVNFLQNFKKCIDENCTTTKMCVFLADFVNYSCIPLSVFFSFYSWF